MAVSILDAWDSAVSNVLDKASNPSGDHTISSANDRFHIAIVTRQANNENVITYTVGGQSATVSGHRFFENGTNDFTTDILAWNEAAIAAMVGTTVSYSDTHSNTQMCHTFATFQDCDQDDPIFTGNDQAEGTTLAIVTTSDPGDMIISAHMAQSANRAPLTYDTLSEQLENSVSGSAHGVAHGDGGDDLTTLGNDGFDSEMSGMCVVLKALGSGGNFLTLLGVG